MAATHFTNAVAVPPRQLWAEEAHQEQHAGKIELEQMANIPMWKGLIAGTTMLTIAGSTLASAQQPSPAERSHHAQLTGDDIAAFTDARIAALKTALKLTPAQEKNWPAVEQALRDISKERIAQHEARGAAGQPVDATERLRDRADALAARAAAEHHPRG
jgi:zinc resistance-associated protein